MRTLVVADDITGANDIAVMYVRSGLRTLTYTCGCTELFTEEEQVAVIDTDSRFLTAEEAYTRVQDIVRAYPDCDRYFDKQCSVFRGNIGAEFDAMLDTLHEEFAVVVPGYPANGRTTINQIHYVNGVRLEDTQFRRDPVHPMLQSDLCEILRAQTRRRVTAITVTELDQGADHVRERLEELRRNGGYVLFDVRDEADLALIASVISQEKIVCGSAGIAYYLGLEQAKCRREPVLAVAGSLTEQTLEQVAYMRSAGYPILELDTLAIARHGEQEELRRLYTQACHLYQTHDLVLIHTSQEPEKVAATKLLAAEHGISNVEISGLISETLAEVTRQLCSELQIRKCIVLGGDTSAAFCRSMRIQGMEILEEVEAGIPLLRRAASDFYFVLKSGSFGTKHFIEKTYYKLLAT